MKVLIADDNPGMRLLLRKCIESVEGVELVVEAENGHDALLLASSHSPVIIFLDIEMPGLNGVECAKKLAEICPSSYIVFITAHEEYMPEAFEIYAFDYIVKPFKPERVKQTILRINNTINRPQENGVAFRENKPPVSGRLIIKNKNEINFININDIIIIQKEDRSSAIYTINERYISSESLNTLEKKLPGDIFFRCHRSYIVNLEMISKIEPYGRWTYVIKLKNSDKDALLTHDKYEELVKIFNF